MLTINASLSNIDFEPLTEVKAKLSEKISKTGESKRLLAITVNGKPKAMLIPYDLFLGWMELKTYPPRHLSLEEWEKESPQRKKAAASIKQLFDFKMLNRKGQKPYKRNALKKLR